MFQDDIPSLICRSYYFQTRKNMNPMCGERVLLAAMRDRSSRLVQTGSPNVVCSLLPEHWRINKALPATFRVVALSAVPDGTEVKLVAGNDENLSGELINSSTTMHDQIARFTDLRFISRSGRGLSIRPYSVMFGNVRFYHVELSARIGS